jgi:hypothetical protein
MDVSFVELYAEAAHDLLHRDQGSGSQRAALPVSLAGVLFLCMRQPDDVRLPKYADVQLLVHSPILFEAVLL